MPSVRKTLKAQVRKKKKKRKFKAEAEVVMGKDYGIKRESVTINKKSGVSVEKVSSKGIFFGFWPSLSSNSFLSLFHLCPAVQNPPRSGQHRAFSLYLTVPSERS